MSTESSALRHYDCPYCTGREAVFDHATVRNIAANSGISPPHALEPGVDLTGARETGWLLRIVLHEDLRRPPLAQDAVKKDARVLILTIRLDGCSGPADAARIPARVLTRGSHPGISHILGSATERAEDALIPNQLLIGGMLAWEHRAIRFRGISHLPIAHLIASYNPHSPPPAR